MRSAERVNLRILGVDPGTRVLGFAVLETAGREVSALEWGALHLAGTLSRRLQKIFEEISALLSRFRPQVLAVEEVFHGRNFQSVMKLGQARGVVLLSAQLSGVGLFECAPAEIKKTVTGHGSADKAQVQRMMARLLSLDTLPMPLDVSDAMAVAFCCAEGLRREQALGVGKRRGGGRKRALSSLSAGSLPDSKEKTAKALYDSLVRSGKANWITSKKKG